MDNLLLDLAAFTVGAYSLVVGAVLFTVPLNIDSSYVDDDSSVVFIFDTTFRVCVSISDSKMCCVRVGHHGNEYVRRSANQQ